MTATGPGALTVSSRRSDRPHTGYLPGLDGLRALSVVAVLAYHLEADWAMGGYLGVEVFFVVSGFLITALLLREHQATGGVDLLAFWGRRARRLLPAVVVLIAAVSAWGAFALPGGELQQFRGDAVAGLLYVQNWHALVTDQPYFAAFGRPSPLRHLWSLAIEEQFYLLWPVVLPFALRRFGRRATAVGVAVAALASAGLMASTADIAAPERAYYGTDTRLFGLLAGALLAWVWRPTRASAAISSAARRTVEVVGVGALVLLAQQFAVRSEFDPWTYPWGFLWVDLLTVTAIVAATHPSSRLVPLVGAWPLRVLGRRSYSVYLWHWPVITCTRPGLDWGLTGSGALAARLALIAGLSELSYRFVEQPVRDGRVQRWLARRSPSDRVRRARLTLAGATATIMFAAVLAAAPGAPVLRAADDVRISTDITMGPRVQSAVDRGPTSAPPTSAPGTTTTATTPAGGVVAAAGTAPSTTVAVAPPPAETPSPPPPKIDPAAVKQVTLVGESVTLGAAPDLQEYYGERIQMDAVEGRSFADGVELIEGLAAHGRLTPWVIVHIGNNGAAPPGALDRVVAAVGPERRLILVNVRVPRRWEDQVNGEIARVVGQHANVVLADWWTLTHEEPGLLVDDGVHLTRQGRVRYRDLLIAKAR